MPHTRTIAYDWQRYPHPQRQRQRLRRAALEHLARFGLLRAIDLAAALAPQRPQAAALSVAQRQLQALLQERLIERATIAHQTVYALSRRGVQALEDGRAQHEQAPAPAPLRRVRLRDRCNPQHQLLIAQTVIAAEARGWIGWTESELRQLLKQPPLQVQGDDGTCKGLWPDALLLAPATPASAPAATSACPPSPAWRLYWVEIDRSRRGAQRLADLVALVRARGRPVRCPRPPAQPGAASAEAIMQLPLARIVVLTASASIARADAAYLQPRIGVGLCGQAALRPLAAGLWSVLADVRLSQPRADGVVVERREVARLIVQPWPEPARGAWFDNHGLPWSLASGAWPPAQPKACSL